MRHDVTEDLNAEQQHRENLESCNMCMLFWRLETEGLGRFDIVKCVIMACMVCVRGR